MNEKGSVKVPNMHFSWLKVLEPEFKKSYMNELRDFLKQEKSKKKIIFPPTDKTFACLKLTALDSVKLVIIGQDPYHGLGQANGLAFSVKDGQPIPPSLQNIFKEIAQDIKESPPENGDLSFWAKQGVLLLNSVLTVEKGNPASHSGKGWEEFTDAVISKLSEHREGLVFLLWGGYAKKKGAKINRDKHLVLTSGHPSPLSANRGYWFGNQHFSKTNTYLIKQGKEAINW